MKIKTVNGHFGKLVFQIWRLPFEFAALVRSAGGVRLFASALLQHLRLYGPKATFALGWSRLRNASTLNTLAGNLSWALVNTLRPILRAELDRIRASGFSSEADLVSIIMPIFRPNMGFLEEAIESVLFQTYRNFELVLVDDGSEDEELLLTLNSLQAGDKRIRLLRLETNQGISEATNTGIRASRGSIVGFLDQDDRLEPTAIEAIVRTFQKNPEAKIVYSDEVIISGTGEFSVPHLKPAFDPFLLMQQNYLCHFVSFSKTFLTQLGSFDSEFDGVQAHEILLRSLPMLNDEEVFHIPHILYHSRSQSSSTAKDSLAKGFLVPKRREIIKRYLAVQGAPGRVAWNLGLAPELGGCALKLRPNFEPLVSIIIPTKDRFELLRKTIESVIARTDYLNYEIIIIDNGTTESQALDYIFSLERQGLAKVVRDNRPFNFSRLVNSGVEQSSGQLVCLLNNDVEVRSSDWLSDLVAWSQIPGVGAVGARLWFPNDTLQHGGVILGLGISRVAGHSHKGVTMGSSGYLGRVSYHQTFTAVTGACLLVSRDNFISVGGFEEALEVAYNDVDFCLKLHTSGLYNIWSPVSNLTHFESASRGYDTSPSKIRRAQREVEWMREKWGEMLEMDPSYHPLLTRRDESFSLASSDYEYELLKKVGLFRKRFG